MSKRNTERMRRSLCLIVFTACTAPVVAADPFVVGPGAFSGAPEVLFDGVGGGGMYSENGATFTETAGSLNVVAGTLRFTPAGGPDPSLDVSLASPQIRVGLSGPANGAAGTVGGMEFFSDAGFVNSVESIPLVAGLGDGGFAGVQAMSPFQSVRITFFGTGVLEDFRFEVPEPSSLMFIGLALVALGTGAGAARRRRR